MDFYGQDVDQVLHNAGPVSSLPTETVARIRTELDRMAIETLQYRETHGPVTVTDSITYDASRAREMWADLGQAWADWESRSALAGLNDSSGERFSKMSAEAEAEMREWDAIIKTKR